ncbi:hypothetical protein [Paludisphaera sp.]|uniref:hypothetical protein n=1 Tax=Paludisphaera sp. TaxID=2017432 RepID=UPI00301CDF1C
MIRGASYKAMAALAVAAALVAQRAGWHASGATRAALGYAASALLLMAVVEMAAPILGRRRLHPAPSPAIRPRVVVLVLTALLAPNAAARPLAPYLVLMPRTPPTIPLAILIGSWAVAVAVLARRGYSTRWLAVSLAGLMVGTRLLAQWVWPFHRLDGDMLENVRRAFEAMSFGHSPYLVEAPPMPYLPLTLLPYAPAWALGVDLRYANAVCDALTAVAAVYLGRLVAIRAGRDADSGPAIEQLLLPCLMLHPIWVHFGANTQYPPSVLLATLLGYAALLSGPRLQAIVLGLATGANQMIGACGPILLAGWARRWGPARAVGLGALAAAMFMLVLAPFLAWDAGPLARSAFLERGGMSGPVMSGRFTFLPLASRVAPHAATIATALVLAAASWTAHASRRPAATLAAMAVGLCAAMLFQPVSFAHYFLPAVALAAILPPADGRAPARPPRPIAALRADSRAGAPARRAASIFRLSRNANCEK